MATGRRPSRISNGAERDLCVMPISNHECERVNATAPPIEALRLVALDCKSQQAALPQFVFVPDEIALLFHDELVAAGPVRTQPDLIAIDDRFSVVSDLGPGIWTERQMCSSSEWSEIRELARQALLDRGLSPRPPDLGWVQSWDCRPRRC